MIGKNRFLVSWIVRTEGGDDIRGQVVQDRPSAERLYAYVSEKEDTLYAELRRIGGLMKSKTNDLPPILPRTGETSYLDKE